MIRVAIVGAGRIGAVHANALKHIKDCKLTATSDPLEEAALTLAKGHEANVLSVDDVAANSGIDAVIIYSPTDVHAHQIEMFARAGKSVFCEKPVDLDSTRVRDCLDAVDEMGTTLMIDFNRIFDPHFMGLKAAIEFGRTGTPGIDIISSRDPGAPHAD